MRYTRLFGKTLRAAPQEVTSKGFELLMRAGYVRALHNGFFYLLPLGVKVINILRSDICRAMDSLGGQETMLPFVHPSDLWVSGGRYELLEINAMEFKDPYAGPLVVAPGYEEAFTGMVKANLRSYRDLPQVLYHFQDVFSSREKGTSHFAGAREYMLFSGVSFHRSETDINNFFPKLHTLFEEIFTRWKLETIKADGEVRKLAAEKVSEFFLPNAQGEEEIVTCPVCGDSFHQNIAPAFTINTNKKNDENKEQGMSGRSSDDSNKPLALEEVYTPNIYTIQQLSDFLDLPFEQLAKCMVFRTVSRQIMAVVRGDADVSEEKLSRFLKEPVVRRAKEEELLEIGLNPGFMSPVNLPHRLESKFTVVVDNDIVRGANFVAGANKDNYHVKNVNFSRDFESSLNADIALHSDSVECSQCGDTFTKTRVKSLGKVYKLGNYFSKSMDVSFQDEKGKNIRPQMAGFSINLAEVMESIAEINHDKDGLIWPQGLSPFCFFLMGIGNNVSVNRMVEGLYKEFKEYTLLDDRNESPGVKFKDADLLGIPYRILVSSKSYEEKYVELYYRAEKKTRKIAMNEISVELKKLIELEYKRDHERI